MKDMNLLREEIRNHEDDFRRVFCRTFDFSDAFWKDEDDLIPLMYDHHRFVAKGESIGEADIETALQYQKDQGCNFLKIDSRFPLPKALADGAGLQEEVTLTMVNLLYNQALSAHYRVNPEVVVKDVQADDIEGDILAADLENYQAEYGPEFIKQFVSAFSKKAREDSRLHYLGAYLDQKLCGYCYYFDDGRYKVLDGLTVNGDSRHKYVASTLIAHVVKASGSRMYLHADRDDTPKEMYRKMGFQEIDLLYEYTRDKWN